jgi:hypothetical protein
MPRPGRIARLLPFVVVAAVYAAVAGYQIDLAGVYMDEVNPDYLAVRVLNWNSDNVPVWVLPGNDVLDHFPVLVALYHGTQQLWLGLPIFWLLGTTVVSLRVAHALFALAVLAGLYPLLVGARIGRWMSAGVAIALAVDPSFVYAFRTQSYITMAPTAWLLASLIALQRRVTSRSGRLCWVFVSGLFAGLAVYGYFVFAFYLPPLAAAVLCWRGTDAPALPRDRIRWLLAWGMGVVLGCIFYFVGYGLAAYTLSGLGGLKDYVVQNQADLGAFAAHGSLWDRLVIEWNFIGSVFYNWWHEALMFGDYTPVLAAPWKMTILLGVPIALWVVAEFRRRATALLRLLLGLEASFCVIALMFGSRLGGHHFVSLLPLSYAALTVALKATLPSEIPDKKAATSIAFPLLITAMICINALGDAQVSKRLRETHGIGLYSDAINHFADDLAHAGDEVLVFTPDWGLFMPVAFLTGGRVKLATDEDYALATDAYCAGRSVVVALIEGNRRTRFARWRRELGAATASARDYRQFDGKVAFEVETYRRDGNSVTCKADAARSN